VKERQHRGDGDQPGRIGVPRWPAALVLLAIGGLYAVLSESLTIGPRVFLLGFVTLLLVPLMTAHRRGSHRLARRLGLAVTGLVTVAVVVSTVLLVSSALNQGTSAPALLRDAALLWIINVATFSVWYWETDSGGPAKRRWEGHRSEDFVFPQMNFGGETARAWSPGFLDYLFLAFNTSTAFSPTDTAFLSRRAKVLMMVQALLSLLIVAVLVGRAVNIFAVA
jgi:uncharacterized membrane protein